MKQYFRWSFLKSTGKWLIVGTLIRMLIIGAISLIVGFGFMSPADSAPLFPQEPELATGEAKAEEEVVDSGRKAEVDDCIMFAELDDYIVCILICAVDVTDARCVMCLPFHIGGTPI